MHLVWYYPGVINLVYEIHSYFGCMIIWSETCRFLQNLEMGLGIMGDFQSDLVMSVNLNFNPWGITAALLSVEPLGSCILMKFIIWYVDEKTYYVYKCGLLCC